MLVFKINILMDLLKLFVLLYSINYICCINENNTSDNEFVPTNEWQVVKPGQKIPPGLHIRSDFQTGITEAKFLDKNEKNIKETAMSLSENTIADTNETSQSLSPEQIKRMLKGIKDESPVNDDGIEINGTKFRSYDELKRDFQKMQMSIKTDLEIIRELMEELRNNVDQLRTKAILSDLEYYLHQIDNAQNFVDMGGLVYLHRFLESDIVDIRSEALRCLSSALQGNAKVKVEAMKNGTLSRLLTQLKSSSDTQTINQIFVVVSAITRQFPIAQLAFINGGGLEISGDIFDRLSVSGDEKITVRLVTLISDWLRERNLDEGKLASSEQDREIIREKENQYRKVDLTGALLDRGWCDRFNLVWSSRKDRNIDYVEKLISSIGAIYPLCRSRLAANDDRIMGFLDDAHRTVASMVDQDTDDVYFRDLLALIKDTRSLIGTDQRQHSEL